MVVVLVGQDEQLDVLDGDAERCESFVQARLGLLHQRAGVDERQRVAAEQPRVDVADLERRRERDAVDPLGEHPPQPTAFFTDSYVPAGSFLSAIPMVCPMRRTRIAALAAAGALVAAGTGVAVATTRSDDAKKREQSVLNDAAKRLDVDAVRAARRAEQGGGRPARRRRQGGQAHAGAGRRDQGASQAGGHGARRARRPARRPGVLRRSPPVPRRAVRDHRGDRRTRSASAARSCGTGFATARRWSRSRRPRASRSPTSSRRSRPTLKQHLDEEVKEGDLTRKQADELLQHLTERLDDLGDLPFPPRPPRGFGHP